MLRPNSFTVSALALAFAQGSYAQNTSTPGPAWVQSEYDTSPPVYPSRKSTSIGERRNLKSAHNLSLASLDLQYPIPEGRTTENMTR
jgi:hypothetical protein